MLAITLGMESAVSGYTGNWLFLQCMLGDSPEKLPTWYVKPKSRENVLWTGTETLEMFGFIWSSVTEPFLYWLIEVVLLHFRISEGTHFITLPLISFYCSQFFLILLSVLYALATLRFHFFLFISTVDGVVTSHMALPSGTASLTHIPFKFQLYPWPLCDNLPSNKTITSYAQRLSVLLCSVSFLKTCSSYLPFDTQRILWSVLIRHERPILETPNT